jgi:hypothetical protein
MIRIVKKHLIPFRNSLVYHYFRSTQIDMFKPTLVCTVNDTLAIRVDMFLVLTSFQAVEGQILDQGLFPISCDKDWWPLHPRAIFFDNKSRGFVLYHRLGLWHSLPGVPSPVCLSPLCERNLTSWLWWPKMESLRWKKWRERRNRVRRVDFVLL